MNRVSIVLGVLMLLGGCSSVHEREAGTQGNIRTVEKGSSSARGKIDDDSEIDRKRNRNSTSSDPLIPAKE